MQSDSIFMMGIKHYPFYKGQVKHLVQTPPTAIMVWIPSSPHTKSIHLLDIHLVT